MARTKKDDPELTAILYPNHKTENKGSYTVATYTSPEIVAYAMVQLAVFKSPDDIAKDIKRLFNHMVRPQTINMWDPTKKNKKGEETWEQHTQIFWDARQEYLARIQDVAIANQRYRLEEMQQQLLNIKKDLAKSKDPKEKANLTTVILDILEQAARESGGQYQKEVVIRQEAPVIHQGFEDLTSSLEKAGWADNQPVLEPRKPFEAAG